MANPARDIADAFAKPSGESMELSVKARMGVTATLFAACMAWNMYLPAENTKDSFNFLSYRMKHRYCLPSN